MSLYESQVWLGGNAHFFRCDFFLTPLRNEFVIILRITPSRRFADRGIVEIPAGRRDMASNSTPASSGLSVDVPQDSHIVETSNLDENDNEKSDHRDYTGDAMREDDDSISLISALEDEGLISSPVPSLGTRLTRHLLNAGSSPRRSFEDNEDNQNFEDTPSATETKYQPIPWYLSCDCDMGVLLIIMTIITFLIAFLPHENSSSADRSPDQSQSVGHWPTDFTADVKPVPCHSHNDYWRKVPLYSAINAGCISVEADVWLFDDDLYVGHTKSSLAANRTLRSLYVDPLKEILGKQNPVTKFQPAVNGTPNGVFDTDPSQTLVLLIDFKTNGTKVWPYVVSQLSPLREKGYLTHFDGKEVVQRPITVVATGNAPFDLVVANATYRDIFFDAPLANLSGEKKELRSNEDSTEVSYDVTNSYYASTSLIDSIGIPWKLELSEEQKELVRKHVRDAHDRGLKARYWEIPTWPRFLRNRLWTQLLHEGVDILNVDDLKSATKKDWSLV